jgi:hypothetical protein
MACAIVGRQRSNAKAAVTAFGIRASTARNDLLREVAELGMFRTLGI